MSTRPDQTANEIVLEQALTVAAADMVTDLLSSLKRKHGQMVKTMGVDTDALAVALLEAIASAAHHMKQGLTSKEKKSTSA